MSKVVNVTFTDWNANKRTLAVTPDICGCADNAFLPEEELITKAICFIKRRYTECMHINAVEILDR